MRTLEDALNNIPTAILRQMAEFWEVPEVDESGRPALLAGLQERMGQAVLVQRALERLDDEEMAALRSILAAGGWMQAALLAQTYGALRSPGLTSREAESLNVTERLYRKGFIFRAFAAQEDWSGAVFFVPGELEPFLPRVPRVSPRDLLQPLASQQVLPIPADRSLHRDLAGLLALLQRERFVPKGGDWPVPLEQALEELLPARYPAYAGFCLSLARQAGFFGANLENVLRPTAEGRQWLRALPWLRAQVLFRAWQQDLSWDELAAVPGLLVDRSGPAEPGGPRRRVLQQLGECFPGTWYSFSSWMEFMHARDPGFLYAGGRPRVRLERSGEVPRGPDAWDQIEGGYLRFLLEGPLHALGLVDLGRQRDEDAFRVTPLGQALLHPEMAPPEMDDEPVMVEGNFEVWVPLEASPYVVFVLEGCAERVRWDQLVQYRLTRPTLQRALQRGLQGERLLNLLARYGRGEVPQNVVFSLQEWASAYGRLRLHRSLLLSAQDAPLLEEILSDPQVSQACAARLSPTVAQVGEEQVEALLERLGQLSHLPQVEEGVFPQEGPLGLTLSDGQGAALLTLLWVWKEVGGEGEAQRALALLAEQLAQNLSPERRAWARRQAERWLRGLAGSSEEDDSEPSGVADRYQG